MHGARAMDATSQPDRRINGMGDPMRVRLLVALLLLAPPLDAAAAPTTLPASPPIPQGLGVNIHFTDPRPGELEMLAAAGFTWVRMDLGWGGMERRKGEYDFSAYDRLTAALDKHGIKALFILDYSNRLYDEGQPPHTDEGRSAFARWAVAVAHHFKGRGYIWEMWNEPNIAQFWKPKPNADDYAKLALAVGKALRDAEPDEMYIGPATSTVDLKFIEACCKAGCLEYWSAVSVHPYRQSAPETAAKDLRALRVLTEQYAPYIKSGWEGVTLHKSIPIINGEWGYSAAWKNFDEQKQGKYLARQLLFSRWQRITVSIWYDWHDDGLDPTEGEHHFGTVHHPYRKDEAGVYEPKPAYLAMKTLTEQLRGYHFNKRLVSPGDDACFILLFSKGERNEDVRLVAWTTAAAAATKPTIVTVPASPGRFKRFSHIGAALDPVEPRAGTIELTLTDAPQYIVPEEPNATLAVVSDWSSLPPETIASSQIPVVFDNTFGKYSGPNMLDHFSAHHSTFRWATRDGAPSTELIPCPDRTASGAFQEWVVIAYDTLRVTTQPISDKTLALKIHNPSGEPFKGRVTLIGMEGLEVEQPSSPLSFSLGQREETVRFSVGACEPDYAVGVQITDGEGHAVIEVPQARFKRPSE
jgi:hypothetical protein